MVFTDNDLQCMNKQLFLDQNTCLQTCLQLLTDNTAVMVTGDTQWQKAEQTT